MINYAERAWNISNNFDPIVRSLLDTDFYKILMLQLIWKRRKNRSMLEYLYDQDGNPLDISKGFTFRYIPVTFEIIVRNKDIKLGTIIDPVELQNQIDYVDNLEFRENELIWLQGNTFYGKKGMFEPEFIEYLRSEFKLAPTKIEINKETGYFRLSTSGCWAEATLWEIYFMTIVNTMRNRAGLKGATKLEVRRIYNEAEHRLITKLEYMAENNVTGLSEFGTRRRQDEPWQELVIENCVDIMKSGFVGTSNAYIAMKLGLEAKGTNAHELPMVYACLANTDDELRASQYEIIRLWWEMYDGNLRIILPDTFGSSQFLNNAPEWIADSSGDRLDSKDPMIGGWEAISFYRKWGRDPMTKMLLPSDGLDAKPIVELKKEYTGKVGIIGYGLGTMLTNDFPKPIGPISIVCKVTRAAGKSAVKLSDNRDKRTGDPEEIARYVRVFGEEGTTSVKPTV